jgi:hypothetical protein
VSRSDTAVLGGQNGQQKRIRQSVYSAASMMLRGEQIKSLGFLLLFHLLDFSALVLNFLLLLLHLALSLLILNLPVLKLVANHISAARSERAANRRSCAGMTNRGTDNGAGASTEQGAHASTLFALA